MPRLGEVLPAHAIPILRALNVDIEVLRRHGIPAESMVSSWGTYAVQERHASFSAMGTGFLLQRPMFDAALADEARRAGVHVFLDANLRDASREDGEWVLHFGARSWTCRAAFVVDATGRRAVFARLAGARTVLSDRLMAYSTMLPQRSTAEHATVVEACELGWWYTAPLPGNQRVVSLLTDVDLGRAAGLPALPSWQWLLRKTQHIVPLCDASAEAGGTWQARALQLTVSPACSGGLDYCVGVDWVAAGDALVSCDPLAGQGITKALQTGVLASFVAADTLRGVGDMARRRYTRMLTAQWDGYRRMHALHYSQEGRWPDAPFWKRRYAASREIGQSA